MTGASGGFSFSPAAGEAAFSPGSYSLRYRREGYEEARRIVEIGADDGPTVVLDAVMLSPQGPNPTASPSAGASATATETPQATVNPSPTATPTAVDAESATATPTAIPQEPSHTATPALTGSATPSATASATPTARPPAAATDTATPSPTTTATPDAPTAATATATATTTQVATATPSAGRTPTPAAPATASATPTAHAPVSPSSTPTASPSATGTASSTASPTPTVTPSGTPGLTASPTATAPATPGATVTPTDAGETAITPPPGVPDRDLRVATRLDDVAAFLYTGANPVQQGVAPDAIASERVAVLRGRVLTTAGEPLPGVTISVLGHPELGATASRADGGFDLAVNGGGPVTLSYEKDGLIPVQRRVEARWNDYAWLPDVVLTAYDTAVTEITGNAAAGGAGFRGYRQRRNPAGNRAVPAGHDGDDPARRRR